MKMFGFGIFAVTAVVAFVTWVSVTQSQDAQSVVDASGNMHVPQDYLRTYRYLGTWTVLADEGQGASELHVVYASPGAVDAFQKTGQFPDDAVLVKEVYEAATGQMTTGTVGHAETLKGWFVMVKDSKGRYPGNALWGDGWGWAWFDVGDPLKTTSTDYKTDSLSCHVPAEASDWVYVQGYPSLKQ